MIKIPEQYYVGIRPKSGGDIPLGFATPFGTDTAFKKRKSTVDTWTGSAAKGARFETYDNVLLEGFRISQEVRRHGWNGGNVVWRIEDPRGFELEISSANFASIVDCCVIDKGVILSKCLWGREGAANILLPENSGPHREAMNFTQLSKKNIVKGDLEIGQFVRMKDGTIAVYCGAYHGFGVELDHEVTYGPYTYDLNRKVYHSCDITPRFLPKRHVFLQQREATNLQVKGTLPDDDAFYAFSDTKNIAEFLDEKMVIDPKMVMDKAVNGESYYGIFPKMPSAVAEKAFKKVEFKVIDGDHPGSIRLYEDPNGGLHHVGWNNFHEEYYSHSGPNPDRNLFLNICPIDLSRLKIKEKYEQKSAQLDRVSKEYFKGWKPKTLIAVLDDDIEVPVLIPYYGHEKGRPMTEITSRKRSW